MLKAVGAEVWPLGVLKEGAALLLLVSTAKWPVENLPPEAHAVTQTCHGEPHALSTLGGMANGKRDPWKGILDELRQADASAIRGQKPGDPRWEMLRPIHVSVEALPEELRARYLDFAVFHVGRRSRRRCCTFCGHCWGCRGLMCSRRSRRWWTRRC